MKIQRGKKNILIMFIMVLIFVSGCQASDFTDQAADLLYKDDENVLMVKNGHPNLYPDITYNQGFSSFFASPTWKYFVGTQQGPDEDGDGNPDYTKENIDVVEFTGYCTYMNTQVKAKIQFVLDKANGTFEASFLSFNDVPQSKIMLLSLIQKSFESYKEKYASSSDDKIENKEDITPTDMITQTDLKPYSNVTPTSAVPSITPTSPANSFDKEPETEINWSELSVDAIYPDMDVESPIMQITTLAPDIIYHTPASENKLGSKPFVITGKVTKTFDDLTEAYKYFNIPVNDSDDPNNKCYSFIIENDNGNVLIVDHCSLNVELLKQAVENDKEIVLDDEYYEYIYKFGGYRKYGYPNIGENIAVLATYQGYSSNADLPIFYYGINKTFYNMQTSNSE